MSRINDTVSFLLPQFFVTDGTSDKVIVP